jgi:ribonuclease HI
VSDAGTLFGDDEAARPALRIYTDGACAGNPGPGGWAWASSRDHFASGGDPATTNNKMELTAVLRAIEDNPGPLHIIMDSTYVKDGLEKWSANWVRNGWRTKAGEPVKNRELWEPLVAARAARRKEITFGWVKGHSGDPMNDLVDELAVIQRDHFRPAGGTVAGSPGMGGKLTDLPIDEQRAERRRRDGRIPDGHLLVVFGPGPDELGGWDPNRVADDVRRRLGEWFTAQAQLHPDLVVVSGLRPGAEVLAAEAALAVGVPYAAVVAFPGIDRNLSDRARKRFAELSASAATVVAFEKKTPADSQAFRAALGRRDKWLINAGDQAVLVWDGADPRLKPLARDLESAFGEDLLVLAP